MSKCLCQEIFENMPQTVLWGKLEIFGEESNWMFLGIAAAKLAI